jgi:selenocysteine lyase/cysteine desulfurase
MGGVSMKSYRHLYNLSLERKEDYLHFAAHSHHPWPDCTFEAHKQYWKDSATHLDGKWDYIFTEIIPKTQNHIAEILNLSHPEMITISPNTHEFVLRLFSCFEKDTLKVLTTDSEFHSFKRQLQRFQETKKVEAKIVPVEPYDTFEKRWSQEIANSQFDMIFTSQVFFNSGLSCPAFDTWIPDVPNETMIVIDGYHAFCAIPINLKPYENRIFYMAGGYKYAQGGEGICFLTVPKNSKHRPVNTGWFASYESLSKPAIEKVQYSESGMRFAGSTFDASGCYRFNSVMETFKKENLEISQIHERVLTLKKYFIEKMDKASNNFLKTKDIIKSANENDHSHFVTFKTANANEIEHILAKNNIVVDSRGDRLRFGFGLYHDLKDIDKLVEKIKGILS